MAEVKSCDAVLYHRCNIAFSSAGGSVAPFISEAGGKLSGGNIQIV